MKQAVMVLLCLLLWTPAQAADVFAEQKTAAQASLQGALTGETQSLISGMDGDGDLAQNLYTMLPRTAREQGGAVQRAAATVTRVAVVLILCSFAGSFSKTTGVPPIILSMAGALGITAVVFRDLSGLMGLCIQTAEQLQVFSKSMLPVLMTALTLTGAPTTAALAGGGTMYALDVCVSLITGLMMPLVSAYVAMITVNAAISNDMLSRLAAFLRWLTVGALKLLLTAFFSYLTISGTVSHGLDASAVKATKFALSGSVPVVGGILSGAADTVLSGAVVLKNSLGLFGMLCVAAICLVPFLRLSISYLIFRAGTALLSTICPPTLARLLDGITNSIGLILGMLGSCSAIVFFELVCAVVMVT